MEVEAEAQVVIVGAGIAGLATSLGLHRLGIRSLVLESSDSLRTTGFAFSTWTNAWKALDALGIGDTLRRQHETLHGNVTSSTISGLPIFEMSFKARGKNGHHEVRCVKRNLLEALANELPSGTIRFSSKVVLIDESGYFKLVHLADGTILKAKVLVGCDGVNSWLRNGLASSSRHLQGDLLLEVVPTSRALMVSIPFSCSTLGMVLDLVSSLVMIKLFIGITLGFPPAKVNLPCQFWNLCFCFHRDFFFYMLQNQWFSALNHNTKNKTTVINCFKLCCSYNLEVRFFFFFFGSLQFRYESVFAASECTIQNMFMSHLFCFVYSSCLVEKELEENPAQLKQHILSKLRKTPDKVRAVIENTELDAFISSPLRYRHPWELLWGNISKGNVCVAGDALHPMTPDIGQGGCSALEDGVVLARCLGEALLKSSRQGMEDKSEEGMQEHKKIEWG